MEAVVYLGEAGNRPLPPPGSHLFLGQCFRSRAPLLSYGLGPLLGRSDDDNGGVKGGEGLIAVQKLYAANTKL